MASHRPFARIWHLPRNMDDKEALGEKMPRCRTRMRARQPRQRFRWSSFRPSLEIEWEFNKLIPELPGRHHEFPLNW